MAKVLQKTAKSFTGVPPLILRDAYQRVLQWFFSFPSVEMSLNDLSQELRISKTAARHAVHALVAEGFLAKKVLGKTWRITAIPGHRYAYSRKLSITLTTLYESGILAGLLEEFPDARAVILFGSYRKGDDTEESDIDIAVEVPGAAPLRIVPFGSLREFGYRKNISINVHLFTRNAVDPNVFANIANGVVLHGFLEVHP